MKKLKLSTRKVVVLAILAIACIAAAAVGFYFLGRHSVKRIEISNGKSASANFMNTTGTTSPTRKPQPQEDGRLPRNIEPIVYTIELFPDIYGNDSSSFGFTGFMSLEFRCTNTTNNIVMNINKLDIIDTSIKVNTADKSMKLSVRGYDIDTKWQFLIIRLQESLLPGQLYSISLNYTGALKTDFAGLYLSAFQRRSHNRYVAATQFSPTDARKAFPCLDEPDRKAQFDITLIRRNDFVSLSNMPKRDEVLRPDNMIADVYQRTPKMSSYLLAMVVGDLVTKTVQARAGLYINAWAAKETVEKTETALQVGANVLTFFERYFGINFPLPKQDILGLPETAVSAMENWGLIIYNDERIYYTPEEYSLTSLQGSVLTIAHEVAHQWFGNLVTMNWWSDLMLKEGFAMYFEYVGASYLYPDWNIQNEYGVREMHLVFDVDSLVTSHPVYKELHDTTEIRQVFDTISYQKGGCMIRMVNFILGETVFQNGLKNYLNKNMYGSVGHDVLWEALDEVRNMTHNHEPRIRDVMDTWIHQMNYPVVTISQEKPGHLHIKQERFLNDAVARTIKDRDGSPFRYIWKIPLTYTTSAQPMFDQTHEDILWMKGKDIYIVNNAIPDLYKRGNWIIANVKQWGYYRVNYDRHIWNNIITQLQTNHSKIGAANRAQIINDLFSLSKAGMVGMELALSSLDYLQYEEDIIPWRAATREIVILDKLLKHTRIYSAFKKRISNIIQNSFETLYRKYPNLAVPQTMAYIRLFYLACRYDNRICVNTSTQLFKRILQNETSFQLDPNIRSTVICSAIENGNETVWRFALNKFNTTWNVNEKGAYLSGLTCTKDSSLQNLLLEMITDTKKIQSRDAIDFLIRLAMNKEAIGKVWDHITNNWDDFMDIFSGSLFLLSRLVSRVTNQFVTEDQLKQVQTFVSATPDLGPAQQAFTQAVESIESNIQWIDTHYNAVEQWLAESFHC